MYAKTKEAYSSSPLTPPGDSDHNLLHPQPMYTPLVRREPAVTCKVKRWSEETEEAPRDCFSSTVWKELCAPHGQGHSQYNRLHPRLH